MKDLELLLPRVMEKAAACPEPTAFRHIRDAAIEFCRRTRIWRESDEFEMTIEGCDSLAPYQETQIYEITSATYIVAPDEEDEEDDDAVSDDGIQLEAVTIDWLDKEQPGWRLLEGNPRWITQTTPNTVRIAPKAAGTLTIELILLPSNDAEQLPDVLVDSYSKEIADGALGTILMLPAEFGNPKLAAVHAAMFLQSLGRFGDRVPRGQQRAQRRTKTQFC